MVLELNIARRVVSELHDAIRQPINLMDENGRIIASTDASRIGTVHSAACQASPIHARCNPSWPVFPITSRRSSRSAFFR